MRIDFGWEFDGTAWDSSGDSFGRLVCGPRELTQLLATRLGVAGPSPTPALRIASYREAARRAIEAGQGDWFADSFELNSWAIASTMLRWRDFLIEYGWTPQANASLELTGVAVDIQQQAFQRLHALAAVEQQLSDVPSWQPGWTDSLADVRSRLRVLIGRGAQWELGISAINLHALSLDELPGVWRELFQVLQDHFGVTLESNPSLPEVRSVNLISSQNIYESALTAARFLSGAGGFEPTHILADAPTSVLDDELSKRGMPRLGVGAQTQHPLLPVFLEAISAPHTLNSLLSVLTMTLPGELGSVPLIPARVSKPLLSALNRSPGIGTVSRPSQMWKEAIESLHTDDDPSSYTFALELDRVLRLEELDSSSETIEASDIAGPLLWLDEHLKSLSAQGALVPQAREDIRQLLELLELTGPIRRTEFTSLLESITTHDTFAPAEASEKWTVSTTASQLPFTQDINAVLLWWVPITDGGRSSYPLTELEVQALHAAGVEVPTARDLATLSTASQLSKLNQFSNIIAIIPEYYAGEATRPHPLLNLLSDEVRASTPALAELSVEDAFDEMSTTSDELVHSRQWTPSLLPVEQRSLPRGNPIERTFEFNPSLLPTKLSFSQIDKILHHPMEWLFAYALGIRPSAVRAMPNTSAMLGTLMHAVHENLGEGAITRDSIEATFNELVPEFYTDLSQAEKQALYERHRATTVRALVEFDRQLRTHNVEVTGREEYFDVPLPELDDDTRQPISLSGYRDVDITSAGNPGVVDLKYTASKHKFWQLIARGEAVQLAVYARSFAENQPGLDRFAVSYYDLAQQSFYPPVGAPVNTNDPLALESLWMDVSNHIRLFLERLSVGEIFDVDNYRNCIDAGLIDPVTNPWTETAMLYETRGFTTQSPNTYTDFDFLTGLAGDFE